MLGGLVLPINSSNKFIYIYKRLKNKKVDCMIFCCAGMIFSKGRIEWCQAHHKPIYNTMPNRDLPSLSQREILLYSRLVASIKLKQQRWARSGQEGRMVTARVPGFSSLKKKKIQSLNGIYSKASKRQRLALSKINLVPQSQRLWV